MSVAVTATLRIVGGRICFYKKAVGDASAGSVTISVTIPKGFKYERLRFSYGLNANTYGDLTYNAPDTTAMHAPPDHSQAIAATNYAVYGVTLSEEDCLAMELGERDVDFVAGWTTNSTGKDYFMNVIGLARPLEKRRQSYGAEAKPVADTPTTAVTQGIADAVAGRRRIRRAFRR